MNTNNFNHYRNEINDLIDQGIWDYHRVPGCLTVAENIASDNKSLNTALYCVFDKDFNMFLPKCLELIDKMGKWRRHAICVTEGHVIDPFSNSLPIEDTLYEDFFKTKLKRVLITDNLHEYMKTDQYTRSINFGLMHPNDY